MTTNEERAYSLTEVMERPELHDRLLSCSAHPGSVYRWNGACLQVNGAPNSWISVHCSAKFLNATYAPTNRRSSPAGRRATDRPAATGDTIPVDRKVAELENAMAHHVSLYGGCMKDDGEVDSWNEIRALAAKLCDDPALSQPAARGSVERLACIPSEIYHRVYCALENPASIMDKEPVEELLKYCRPADHGAGEGDDPYKRVFGIDTPQPSQLPTPPGELARACEEMEQATVCPAWISHRHNLGVDPLSKAIKAADRLLTAARGSQLTVAEEVLARFDEAEKEWGKAIGEADETDSTLYFAAKALRSACTAGRVGFDAVRAKEFRKQWATHPDADKARYHLIGYIDELLGQFLAETETSAAPSEPKPEPAPQPTLEGLNDWDRPATFKEQHCEKELAYLKKVIDDIRTEESGRIGKLVDAYNSVILAKSRNLAPADRPALKAAKDKIANGLTDEEYRSSNAPYIWRELLKALISESERIAGPRSEKEKQI